MASNPGLVAAVAALAGGKFDASKHARGSGGKFTSMGGAGAKKPGGSVAMAHSIFDKLKGKPKSEMLAAAKAAGINDNTAKTQLYHWQKKQATAALAGNEAPTKADLQAAAAKALGVKQAAKEPTLDELLEAHAKDHLKGYDDIATGKGTADEKQAKLTQKLFDDMDAVGPTGSIAHLQDAYEKAAAKIKKQGDAEVLAKAGKEPAAVPKPAPTPPKPEPKKADGTPPGHYTGTDGKLYYKSAATGDTYNLDPMTGLVKSTNPNPPAAVKLHGQVGLHKAMQAHDEHLAGGGISKADKAKPETTPPVAEKPKPFPFPGVGQKTPPDLDKLGPTKYVHALADHMKGAEKKAVIAAAVSAGVNKSTAGVQYGKWAAKQAGTPPQMEKSPEPAALQAKQPQDMTDKELDKALDSYQGKINTPNPTKSYAPEPYKHKDEYSDYAGGKALTAKLGPNEVYTNKQQGKTFYKTYGGAIHEHTGVSGAMTKVAGDGTDQYHYDPNTKIVYKKTDGVLKPVQGVKTPVFKNDQPYDPGDHVFKDDAWSSGTNGIQNPNFGTHGTYGDGQFDTLKAVHKAAGVIYNDTSSAVKSYTGSGYHAINGELRSSKGATVGNRARAIDKLMETSSFKEDTIMWRGVGHGGTEWNGSPPPPALIDHGFTSVSFKPSVAKGFSDGKTLFRVKVPKGFPGLNVAIGSPGSGEAGLHGEAEVMLPRGTTYKAVARHAKAAGKWDVVDLEPQLPQWWIDKHGSAK